MSSAMLFLQDAFRLYQSGQPQPAAQLCQQALEIDPRQSDAWHLLAALAYQQGQFPAAISAVGQALQHRPDKAEYYSTLGCVLQSQGKLQESLAAHHRAVELAPNNAQFHCNLGAALQEARCQDDAANSYGNALRLDPTLVEAHYNLGNLCVAVGRTAEAEIAYRRAIQLVPRHLQAVANLSNLLLEQGRYADALTLCLRAIEIAPDRDELRYRLAVTLRRVGRTAEAMAAYDQTLAINSDHAEAHFGRAMVWLQQEDFARGWREFEHRRLRRGLNSRSIEALPEWDGTNAKAHNIGVWCEESLEDEILWSSCLPDLTAQAGGVSIECDARLVPLYRRSFPTANVHCREKWETPAWGAHTSQLDCHFPSGSLPRLVRPSVQAFPQRPFLVADDEARLRWRERLAELGPGLRIGFCWQPTDLAPRQEVDQSQWLADWAKLLSLDGAHWINLNGHAPIEQIDLVRDQHGASVIDWPECDFINDLDQLASLISALDLVITTPTHVAHLAGGLGVETWTLLPADTSWYWFLDRDNSPWYPRMKLFRTPRGVSNPTSLAAPLAQVQAEIAQRLGAAADSTPSANRPRTAPATPVVTLHEPNKSQIAALLAAGQKLETEKQNVEAIAHYQQAIERHGDDPGLLMRLGVVQLLEEQFDAAIESLRRAVDAAPHDPICLFHLAVGYSDAKRREEAVATLRRALRLHPTFYEAHLNLGAILEGMGRLDDSVTYCQQATALNPNSSSAHYNLGNVRLHLGHLDAALESYARVLELEPEFPKAHWNRAVVLLLMRRFGQAWPEWGYREAAGEVVIDHFEAPVWDGSSLSDKTILIHPEQGIGDEIMFASCFGEVIAQAKQTVIACAPRLKELFARSFSTAQVMEIHRPSKTEWLPQGIDCTVTAGDLPALMRTSWERFPRQQSFLKPDPALVDKWRRRIDALGPGLRVGISWRAGGKSSEQRRRTSPLDDWGPVLAVPGVHFINLQYGNSVQDIAFAREKFGAVIHDWPDADPLKDLDNFAAQLAALDMVFSIGNTTIHMAGALGVPTWAMAPHVPGWRYMIEGDELPWYRSVKVFRQTRPDDWTMLYAQMAEKLAAHARSLGYDERTVSKTPAVLPQNAVAGVRSVGETHAAELPAPAADASAADLVSAALIHHRAGQFASAESFYRQAIQRDPENWNAHQLLGAIASETNRPDEAIALMERALELRDTQDKVRYNLANVLRTQGRLDEAVRHLNIAIKNRPGFAEAHLNLGCVLQKQGDVEGALASYRRAVDLKPNCAEAHHNIGHLLFGQEHYDEAIQRYRRALELRSNYPDAQAHLAEALRRTGDASGALAAIDAAVAQAPRDAALHVQRAQLLLEQGQFAAGWEAWKWRSKCRRQRQVLVYPFPAWDGRAIAGQTLLVSAEDDIETEIMFASCLPEVLPRVGHCVIDCLPELVQLFARSFAGATLHPCEYVTQQRWLAEVGKVHCQIPMGSLPMLQRPDRASFPPRRGHLLPDITAANQFRQQLARAGAGLNVGLAIAPSGSPREQQQRAPQLGAWSSLLATPGINWVALGGAAECDALRELARAAGKPLHILEPVDAAQRPEAIAAQAAALDLVISVESVTAHLAAGVGVETWVLLAPSASWRWPASGDRTPWYSSARLWRAAKPGAWATVMQQLGQALAARVPAPKVIPAPHVAWHEFPIPDAGVHSHFSI